MLLQLTRSLLEPAAWEERRVRLGQGQSADLVPLAEGASPCRPVEALGAVCVARRRAGAHSGVAAATVHHDQSSRRPPVEQCRRRAQKPLEWAHSFGPTSSAHGRQSAPCGLLTANVPSAGQGGHSPLSGQGVAFKPLAAAVTRTHFSHLGERFEPRRRKFRAAWPPR